jgi:hypothetical protein
VIMDYLMTELRYLLLDDQINPNINVLFISMRDILQKAENVEVWKHMRRCLCIDYIHFFKSHYNENCERNFRTATQIVTGFIAFYDVHFQMGECL